MAVRFLKNYLVIATIAIFMAPLAARAAFTSPVATPTGAVYAASNDVHRNTIAAYRRAADGTLTFIGLFSTGGRGSGGTVDPLQSQNSLLLSPDHHWLFAVNSGSGDISVFEVRSDGDLRLVDREASGGGFPVSLALSGNLMYVLNAGGAGNVTGFWVRHDGDLDPIPGSTQLLSATSAGGASIAFSPDGSVLEATERLTNLIDTFPIGPGGVAQSPVLNPSNGKGVFSLDFAPQGALLTTETAGAPGGSAVSSYALQTNGTLQVVTGSAPTGFAAACWIVVTLNGQFAYVANAGSGEISEVGVGNNGDLTVLGATSSGAGSTPLDLALSQDDHFLYAVTAGDGRVTEFSVGTDGSLTALGKVVSFPAKSGQNGIAAF